MGRSAGLVRFKRDLGLLTGGSWILVKKTTFSKEILEQFRFLLEIWQKISISQANISDFWRPFLVISTKISKFPFAHKKFQKFAIYSYSWASYSITYHFQLCLLCTMT